MTLFVSYTRSDDAVVRDLKSVLEQLGHLVWLDHQIHGGEQWWKEIIQQIQGAEVFLFVLSKASWGSRPCRLELDYARRLGIPVVPVQVGPVASLKISLAKWQIVDYRVRTIDTALALGKAVKESCDQTRQLPDPLPEPPEMPFEYLFRLASLMEVQEISRKDQATVIAELRQRLKTEDDDVARNDILMFLRELRDRNEITVSHAAEIDEILGGIQAAKVPATGGATRLSSADYWQRPRPGADPGVGSSASSDASSQVPAPRGSGENRGQGPTSSPTLNPLSSTGSKAGGWGRSARSGEGPAPHEDVIPEWLIALRQAGAGATAAGPEPHLWPRPNDTSPPPRARKWWLEEQGPDSEESSAEPTVETPAPSVQTPAPSVQTPTPPSRSPSSPATGRFRTVATLVIGGLLIAIALVVVTHL